jgi:hypothetical protein
MERNGSMPAKPVCCTKQTMNKSSAEAEIYVCFERRMNTDHDLAVRP